MIFPAFFRGICEGSRLRTWLFQNVAQPVNANQGAAGPSATTRTAAAPLPSTSASAAQASLFAVLEARHCKSPEPAACEAVTTAVHDTIAIAGQDGYAKAKTTFAPRILPILGNA